MILCYDSASQHPLTAGVPRGAAAVMFYIDGAFNNQQAFREDFPHLFPSRAIGLTVTGHIPAEGEDYEPGDWQGNSGKWARASIIQGVHRPILYGDGSDFAEFIFPSLEAEFGRPLAPPGPGRRFRTILADPDGNPDIPSNHDGKQYWWSSIQGKGRGDYDISALRDDFFLPTPPTPPIPTPPKPPGGAVNGPYPYVTADRRVGFVVSTDKGEVLHIEQQNAPGTVDPETGKAANTDFWRKDDGTPNWLGVGTPGA